MVDRIFYEHVHEAVGGDFVIPKSGPISEEWLGALPVGVQLRHIIRKLRLDIQRAGSCDFRPLKKLMSQLTDTCKLSEWQAHLSTEFYMSKEGPSYLYRALHKAAYSFVVSRECLAEPLICIWVRNYLLRALSHTSPFPITKFAEIWNTDSDSDNLLTLAGGDLEGFGELPLLHVSVLCNKLRIVRSLVKDNPNLSRQPYDGPSNAFHLAASIGSVDCYRALLHCKNAKIVEGEPGQEGNLPLHIAARNGHKHAVEYILSLHSNHKYYVNERNIYQQTPLMHAAMSGEYDVVQFLLGYPWVDITVSDRDGKTALDHAHGNEDIMRLLLSKFPDQYFNIPDQISLATPLHLLAIFSGQRVLNLVLSNPSTMPDQVDAKGETPLCYSIISGNLEAVKALGIRRDVNVTKLSTNIRHDISTTYIGFAKERAHNGNRFSQILDWLKTHCSELEADLADWEIGNEGTAQDAGDSEERTEEEE
ncbi:ankyrin-2 ankyrin [Colletotrichum kahawae]|uniref:Ankyrin-2 ankyrin n=1 Tax=Colletotrichum kahawae TaxID=34407 RepID=A0AAE0DCB6_COLKA|nr:ankyrin-2 ankyrin [Colletotrichum kahawae]